MKQKDPDKYVKWKHFQLDLMLASFCLHFVSETYVPIKVTVFHL